MKLARAYHLARGEDTRSLVIGRYASYHGNTLGALDVGGKEALKRPYAPWLGRFGQVSAAYEYRCANPGHPDSCGAWLAHELEAAIAEAGPRKVAAFIAEPVAGATLAAAVPTDDYWPAVAEVCRRHGVLLIADEVMTGFGRTGRWFGVDHWGVRPDILTTGQGPTSGYLPFGFACSGDVSRDRAGDGSSRVHLVAQRRRRGGRHAVLRRLRDGDLVRASAERASAC
jgi:adenosylmethionine-8-amino-7-oxononanoate aminotransferase